MEDKPDTASFDHRSVIVGTAYLMVGNIFGQLASLAGLLLISRIYAPAEVGLWALFLSVGFLVPLLAGLRYELSIVIVDNEDDARHLALLTVLVGLACALGVTGLALLLNAFGDGLLPANWQKIAYAYGPYIFANSFINAGASWAIRKRHFLFLMLTRLGQPLATLALQYLLRHTGFFGNGLIVGHVVGCALTALAALSLLWAPLYSCIASKSRLRLHVRMRALARREKGFPLFSVPYAIVSNFANQVIVIAMGAWYSLATVGFFNMAFRTLNAPMMLIGSALSQAIMPSLSAEKHRISTHASTVCSIIRLLGWIHIPPLIFIVVHGLDAYKLVFGTRWEMSGLYAAYLCMAVFGGALTIWFERIFDILGKQKRHLMISSALYAMVFTLFVGAHYLFDNPTYTIAAWSFGMLAYALVWMVIVFRMCGFSLRALARVIAELVGVGTLTTLCVFEACKISNPYESISAIALIFALYGVGAWFALKDNAGALFMRASA